MEFGFLDGAKAGAGSWQRGMGTATWWRGRLYAYMYVYIDEGGR